MHDDDREQSLVCDDYGDDSVEENTCEMVTNGMIAPGSEVFNTYGELSNAELLLQYGFMLEDDSLQCG